MRWGLRLDRAAVQDLYKLERRFVPLIWAALHTLAETPDSSNLQPDEDELPNFTGFPNRGMKW